MKPFRTETELMGEIQAPADAHYGAQTARLAEKFPISGLPFPRLFRRAPGLIKQHAATRKPSSGKGKTGSVSSIRGRYEGDANKVLAEFLSANEDAIVCLTIHAAIASPSHGQTRSGAARQQVAGRNAGPERAAKPKAQSMKYRNIVKPLAVTICATMAFMVGCKPSATETRMDTAEQFDEVKKETKEAAQAMKEYAYAQKTEFVATMQGQLDEINRDLEQLSAKIEKSSDEVKADAKPKLQALRDQAAKLSKQLDVAKNATESTWDDVKAGFTKGYSELKDGFNEARQWVSDKIAP